LVASVLGNSDTPDNAIQTIVRPLIVNILGTSDTSDTKQTVINYVYVYVPGAAGGSTDGGGSGFDAKNYRKPKPIVIVRHVNSNIKQKPKIKVTKVIF